MDKSYLEIRAAIVRRRRRLNALEGARHGATIAMAFTLTHLIAVYLDLMALVQPWWVVILANGLAAWVGARWGQSRPVNVQGDLYRVDRAEGLGERLSTIYELHHTSGEHRFLRALHERIAGVSVDPRRALRMGRGERRGWLGLGGLSAASALLLGLWFMGVPPLSVSDFLAPAAPSSRGTLAASQGASADENFRDAPQAPAGRHGEGSSRDEDGRQGDGSISTSPCDPSGIERATLSSDDPTSADCGSEGRGRSSPFSSPSETSGEQAWGASEEGRADSHVQAEGLRQLLAGLPERLESGELTEEQVREHLEELARRVPSEEVRQALERVAQAEDAQALRERLEHALSELERLAGERPSTPEGAGDESTSRPRDDSSEPRPSDADGSEGEHGERLDAASTAGEPSESEEATGQEQVEGAQGVQGERANAGGEGEEQGAGGQESAAGEGSQATDRAASGQTDQAQGDEASAPQTQGAPSKRSDSEEGRATSQATEEPGGSAAGEQTGVHQGGPTGAERSALEGDLLIETEDLPEDAQLLKGLLTRGVPMDLVDEPGTLRSDRLRLDLNRVETLLRLRDLPVELRGLVRAYFLALAGEG